MLFYILLILIIALLLYIILPEKNYWRKRNIPQIDGLLWKFAFGNRSIPEYFKEIYDASDSNVGIFMGRQPALILKDLNDAQAILSTEFQSFYQRGIVSNPRDTLSDHILFIEDFKRWKCIRQKLSPVFTSAKLRNMFYIMDKCARDFVDMVEVKQEMGQKSFDMVYTYTTASIAASVFGIDTNLKSTMDSPFVDMAKNAVAPSTRNNLLFLFSSVFPKLFLALDIRFFGPYEEFFVGSVKKVLESRRKEKVKRHDFIDMCVELQSAGTIVDETTGYSLEPTDELLAAQAFFFFLAGSDTTAATMHFTLLELASNQKILTRLHDEIDRVFLGVSKQLTYNDIEKLEYLDMVISESMRKIPTIGVVQRKCVKSTLLPSSKMFVEKDEVVIIPVYGVHTDEKYYPKPEIFDPERFAPDNLSKLKKFSFLPFGEGNRVCIGSRFARLQLKAGLTWLLRVFTLVEKPYNPVHFERSSFSLRDTDATYKLVRRNI